MMKMRKHILYIAIGLLAAAAIATTLLALNGFVTLPFFGKPIEQPPAGELHPQQGLTPAEVERLIAELPEHPAEADAARIHTARLAYRCLSAQQQARVGNLEKLVAAEKALTAAGESENPLTAIGVDSRVVFTGGGVYGGSRTGEPARSFTRESLCVVTFYAEGAPHPFHVVSMDEEGIYGWVDADTIRPH